MKMIIRILVTLEIIHWLTGCASHPRTKWTDPAMRVMVDPDGIDAHDYIRIVNALKASGKWFVVDRRDGLRAIFKEQKMIHRDHPDKFKDEEKYSIWGRLYGVGGVVIGKSQCVIKTGFFKGEYEHCVQNLAIVSANSGEVIATAEGQNDDGEGNLYGDVRIASDWTDTVEKLNDNFPKNFEFEKYDAKMRLFRQEAKEEAIRQKEFLGQDKIDQDDNQEIYDKIDNMLHKNVKYGE